MNFFKNIDWFTTLILYCFIGIVSFIGLNWLTGDDFTGELVKALVCSIFIWPLLLFVWPFTFINICTTQYKRTVFLKGSIINKKYIKPFREITKEDWWEALEVLPPEKWQTKGDVEIFRMIPHQTGNITAHYARYGKKYYYANRNTNIDYDDIANEIKAL